METKQYQRLGLLTYWMFVLENSMVSFVGFFLFFFSAVLKVADIAPIGDLLNWSIVGSLVVMVIGAVFAFGIATVEYYSYQFVLGDNDLRIRRGIMNIEEASIPYRHIDDIEIERPLMYLFFGASTLVIYTAADTSPGIHTDESEGRLPAIPKAFAEELREELLRRANIQETIEVTRK